jgi:hypothetical protein
MFPITNKTKRRDQMMNEDKPKPAMITDKVLLKDGFFVPAISFITFSIPETPLMEIYLLFFIHPLQTNDGNWSRIICVNNESYSYQIFLTY